jgi:hypothetical protein
MTIKPRLPARSNAQSYDQPSNHASLAAPDCLLFRERETQEIMLD